MAHSRFVTLLKFRFAVFGFDLNTTNSLTIPLAFFSSSKIHQALLHLSLLSVKISKADCKQNTTSTLSSQHAGNGDIL
jgi:hypothetical protein